MRIKKSISFLLLISLIFAYNCSNVFAYNYNQYSNEIVNIDIYPDPNIPDKLPPIPDVKAWVVDLDGNVEEVIPLSVREKMRVPNDGYIYSFYEYQPDNVTKVMQYKEVGSYTVQNKTSSPASIVYEQKNSYTSSREVSSNISGKSEVALGFLGKVEFTLGVSCGKSKTWSTGNNYGATFTILPGKEVKLTNWQVGVNSNGRLAYKKYSPSGTSLVGMYYETCGGTAISMNDVHIIATEKSVS